MTGTTPARSAPVGRARVAALLAALLVLVAVVRIAATYRVFNQTFDEPAHLATGLEWIQFGRYRLEAQHPPLSRVAVAIGPYLDGVRLTGRGNMWEEGNAALFDSGARTVESYLRVLTLARLGVLPFFLAAALVVWLWTRRLWGAWAALAAVALFTLTPTVLAHAGLATTDVPAIATLLALIYGFTRWLERLGAPGDDRRSVLVLGVLGAIALLTKFSSLLFFPAAALPIAAAWWGAGRNGLTPGRALAAAGRGTALALLAAVPIVWAAYRFSVGDAPGGVPTLAPELFEGIRDVVKHNRSGHRAYLLGMTGQEGWWYFFPVALAVKAPLGLLLLGVGGAAASLVAARRTTDWRMAAPALAAAAILAAALSARINIGVRHVLALFPLLAMAGGYAAVRLWGARRRVAGRLTLAALGLWLAVASARAHPEYLAYFNETAASRPEHFLLDSDLDWGQDLLRLAREVRARRIDRLALIYSGTAHTRRVGLPPDHRCIRARDRVTGWVAVSENVVSRGIYGERLRWLEPYAPSAVRVGSIRLYHVPPGSVAETPLEDARPVTMSCHGAF
jgi:4-amino-4-deoxy-L-arabinose transferase-like glycosyltransferase